MERQDSYSRHHRNDFCSWDCIQWVEYCVWWRYVLSWHPRGFLMRRRTHLLCLAKERMVFLCQSIPPMLIAVGEGLPNPERVFCVWVRFLGMRFGTVVKFWFGSPQGSRFRLVLWPSTFRSLSAGWQYLHWKPLWWHWPLRDRHMIRWLTIRLSSTGNGQVSNTCTYLLASSRLLCFLNYLFATIFSRRTNSHQ